MAGAKRWEILERLASIVSKLDLPIVHGCIERSKYPHLPELMRTQAQRTSVAHTAAFLTCSLSVEAWMRTFSHDEVPMLIAEDAGKVKSLIKQSHAMIKNKENFGAEMLVSSLGLSADNQDSGYSAFCTQ